MTIETQRELEDIRLRVSLTTLNVETDSRIQQLSPGEKASFEEYLRVACEAMTHYLSKFTKKP